MNVDRDVFLNMCKRLLPLTKTGIDGIALFTGKDFAGYNQVSLLAFPFETDFCGSVPIKDLVAILRKMHKGDVDLHVSRSELSLISDDMTGIVVLDRDDYRMDIVIDLVTSVDEPHNWDDFVNPEIFVSALRLCRQAVSRIGYTATRFVHLGGDEIIGADDFRITIHKIQEFIGDYIMLGVPESMLLESFDLDQYAYTETQMLCLGADDSLLIVHNYSDSFDPLSVSNYFDIEGQNFHFPKVVGEAIDRAKSMVAGGHLIEKTIEVLMEPKRVTITAQKDSGAIRVFCDIPELKIKKPQSFRISPIYLGEALNGQDSDVILGENSIMVHNNQYSTLIGLQRV